MLSLSKCFALLPALSVLLLNSVPLASAQACSSLSNVKMTNYGWDDNSPPGANIAYSCPRGAAGTSTGTIVTPPTTNPSATPTDPSDPSAASSIPSAASSGSHKKGGKGKSHHHSPPERRWASKRSADTPQAGGVGTFEDPLTMATSTKFFTKCATYYVPRLQKYVIFEDDCVECDSDADQGIMHIDIWTGSNTGSGGKSLLACEDSFTPGSGESVISDPPSTLPVDCKYLHRSKDIKY